MKWMSSDDAVAWLESDATVSNAVFEVLGASPPHFRHVESGMEFKLSDDDWADLCSSPPLYYWRDNEAVESPQNPSPMFGLRAAWDWPRKYQQ